MIRMRVTAFNDLSKLVEKERKQSIWALQRAGAYTRGVVMRTIRPRKRMVSKPGNPPFDHGTFRKSMRYAVDRTKLAAYVGPVRFLDKALSGNAPATLEYGGTAGFRTWNWFSKNGPNNASDVPAVASWFRSRQYVPLYMGRTKTDIRAQVRRDDALRGFKARARDGSDRSRRFDKWLRKGHVYIGDQRVAVYFAAVRNRGDRMADRAAELTTRHYGFPYVREARVAPRPYLAPSLQRALPGIRQIFANSLPPALKARG